MGKEDKPGVRRGPHSEFTMRGATLKPISMFNPWGMYVCSLAIHLRSHLSLSSAAIGLELEAPIKCTTLMVMGWGPK